MKIFMKLLIIATLLLITVTNFAAKQSEIAGIFARAAYLYKHKKYNKAIVFFKKGLNRGGNKALFNYNLANCYYLNGNIPKAQNCYKKVIKFAPLFISSYLNYARLCLQFQSEGLGIAMLKKASLHKPKNQATLALLGDSYSSLKAYPQAIISYEKILEINPDRGDIRIKLAHQYLLLEDYTTAIKTLKEAAITAPQREKILYLLAKIYFSRGKRKLALKTMEQAVMLDNTTIQMQMQLAQYYQVSGDNWMALTTIERIDPASTRVYLRRAHLKLKLGYEQQAIKDFLNAMRKNYSLAAPHLYNLLINWYNNDRIKKVQETCHQVLKKNSNASLFKNLLLKTKTQ